MICEKTYYIPLTEEEHNIVIRTETGSVQISLKSPAVLVLEEHIHSKYKKCFLYLLNSAEEFNNLPKILKSEYDKIPEFPKMKNNCTQISPIEITDVFFNIAEQLMGWTIDEKERIIESKQTTKNVKLRKFRYNDEKRAYFKYLASRANGYEERVIVKEEANGHTYVYRQKLRDDEPVSSHQIGGPFCSFEKVVSYLTNSELFQKVIL